MCFIVDSWDTLGESVRILFMVAWGLLGLVHELLDQVLALNSLVVFEGRVHKLVRVVHHLMELSLHQLVGKVVEWSTIKSGQDFCYDSAVAGIVDKIFVQPNLMVHQFCL